MTNSGRDSQSDNQGREFDILLVGATGFTGRLIALELARMGKGLNWAIAGREKEPLEALAAGLKKNAGQVLHLSGGDKPVKEDLIQLAARARVVLSAAGPFHTDFGKTLLEACLAAGSHYLDISSEQSFHTFARSHHARASRQGVVLIPGLGYNSLPADFGGSLLDRQAKKIQKINIYYLNRVRWSPGSLRSLVQEKKPGSFFLEEGRERPAGAGQVIQPVDLGAGNRKWAAAYPMADVIALSASTGSPNITTFVCFDHEWQARVLQYLGEGGLKAVQWPGVRHVLGLFLDFQPDPDEENRSESYFRILAEATGGDQTTRRVFMEGHDPYGLTARAAALGAVAVTRPSFEPRGFLTPSQAFPVDDFLRKMSPFLRLLPPNGE